MAIKGEIERRWGTIDLLDILKYAEFDTDFIAEFTSVATREMLSKDVLRRRLLLVLFGLVILSRPKGVLHVVQEADEGRVICVVDVVICRRPSRRFFRRIDAGPTRADARLAA